MNQEILCDDEHEFLEKLKEVVQSGAPRSAIEVYTPVPVPAADEILNRPPTWVRWYAFLGAIAGCVTGLALTIYTVLRYPLMTSAKPYVSLLPFLVIAFELTILFGSLSTFVGFLLLGRLPYVPRIIDPLDYGNRFAIVVHEDR